MTIVLGESNFFDLGIQLVVTVGAILAVAIPLWFSQRSIHRKQDKLYEHVNNVEEHERVEGDMPRKPTLGSIARETKAEVSKSRILLDEGFSHEQHIHEEIRADLRREMGSVNTNLRSLTDLVHQHGERLDAQRDAIEIIKEGLRINGGNGGSGGGL